MRAGLTPGPDNEVWHSFLPEQLSAFYGSIVLRPANQNCQGHQQPPQQKADPKGPDQG